MAFVTRQEWLNQNAHRAFPLREDSSPLLAKVPECILVDASFRRHAYEEWQDTWTEQQQAHSLTYLGGISLQGNILTIYLGPISAYEIRDGQIPWQWILGPTIAIDITKHVPNTEYALYNLDVWHRIVVGDLTELPALWEATGGGTMRWFNPAIPFEARCHLDSTDTAVTGIHVLPDAVVNYNPWTAGGDGVGWPKPPDSAYAHARLVRFHAGTNIRLYRLAPNTLVMEYLPEQQFTSGKSDVPVVKAVNGITNKHLQLIGSERVEVYNEGTDIHLRDTGAQPCEGCPELDTYKTTLAILQATVARLEAYNMALSQQIASFAAKALVTLR